MSDKEQQHEDAELQFVVQSKGFCMKVQLHLHGSQTEDEFCKEIREVLSAMDDEGVARMAYQSWHAMKAKIEIEKMTREKG